MRALARHLLLILTMLGLNGGGVAFAAPDQLVFGPQKFTRGKGAPNSYDARFALPADLSPPYLLRIGNGLPDGSQRVTSATVAVNGVQLAGPNDFNPKIGLIERDVALTPNNTLEVRLAGAPGSQLTLTILGTLPQTIPVALTPSPLNLTAGASGQLNVQLAPTPRQSGSLALASDNPQIAGIPPSATYSAGQNSVAVTVQGVAPGQAAITASANGGSASGIVQVNPAPPTLASLLPPTLTVTQGSRASLRATLSAAQSADVRIELSSSDAAILAVPLNLTIPAGSSHADFTLSALAPGNAQISAHLNGSSAASQVTVTPAPPTLVSLLPASSSATLGAGVTLQLTISAAQLAPTDISLSIAPEGLLGVPSKITVPAGQVSVPLTITTLALGTAGISASLNGSSVAAVVQIVPPAPALVSLLPSPLAITQDASGSLTVTLNAQQLANTEIQLTSDAPTLIKLPASITIPAGQLTASFAVTGLAVGNASITASLAGSSQSAQIAVVPHAAQPVSLLPDPLPLQQGASGLLTLTINAAQLADTALAISNSAPGIVQAPTQLVVPAGQLSARLPVTALAAGSATLATSLNGATTQASVVVTLPPPIPAGLEPAQLTLPKGAPGTLKLSVTRAPVDATVVALASSDPGIAEVPATVTLAAGALTADIPLMSRSEGSATISASLNGGSASSQVTVTAPELIGLTLSPLTPTAFVGETVAFQLQGSYTDASVANVTHKATWSSSAPAIVGVNSMGAATALAVGNASITAALANLSANTLVKVDAVPVLSLSPANASLKVDGVLSLSVTSSVAEAGGLPVTLTAAGIGGIAMPSGITIPAGQTSATFSVTGTSYGDVVITATAPRRVAASATLQVLPRIQITSLNPSTGPVGSQVTLHGQNFDPIPANNDVRFNGERAVVGSASATTLQVIVPVRATSGPVTVATPAGTATSPTSFTVQLQQDFDLTLSPGTLQAPPGGTGTTRIRLDSRGLTLYAYAASLSVAGLPAGITARFERPTVFANGESGLQLTVPAGTPAGSYPIVVQATGATELGHVTRGKTLTIEVLAAGSTTVSGRVLHAGDDQPFVGARIRLGTQETTTDASGYYRFLAPMVLGSQIVLIDGHTANTETTRYASAIAMPVQIIAGQDNLVLTSYMSPVDATKSVTVIPGTQAAVTMPDLPNYSLNIPAGAILYGWDGTPVTQINVRTIPVDRLPIKPLPAGVETRSVYLYYFFREGGANPTTPIPVTMINDLDATPGEKIELWYYDESTSPDPSSNQWKVMGLGTVSADGKRIVSDPGVGIPKFCCGASFARRMLTAVTDAQTGALGGDGDGVKSCKPVDLASGNNLPFEMRGFGINALMPANFNCQYRSTDPRISLFGRGSSFSYDWTAALLADAVQITTPEGVKYFLAKGADGIYRAGSGKSAALGWEVRINATGRTLRFAQGQEMDFNAAGLLTAVRNPEGQAVRFERDVSGWLTRITDSNGRGYALTTQAFTGAFNGRTITVPLVTSITDALGRVVRYTYDSNGRLATYTDAANNVTSFIYDANHRVTRRTLPDGGAINFEYDGAGRTSKETLEDGTSAIRYAYQTVGSLVTQTTVTDPLGRQTDYRFNGQGYVTRISDALGRVTSKTLNPATNLVESITDPAGRITRYSYDAKGKLTQVTDPAGNLTKIDYDAIWNKPIKLTDALGQVTLLAYGDKGRLIQSTDATGAIRQIAYTPQGLPSTLTDPLGRITSLAWDNEGNLVAATDPLGNTHRRRYDDANRLIETTDPLGHSQTLTPDVLDRVTQTKDANGGLTTLAYDALDRLTSLTDPRGNPVERRSYNLRGQLTQRLDAANRPTNYEYDAAGNPVKITDRKGQVTMIAYDALNRPIEIKTADGRITTTDYDLAGNVAALRDNQSGDLLFSYDLLNRLTRVVSDQGTVDYEYDALGRRSKRTINGTDPADYSYDQASRLTKIDYRGKSTRYTYDLAGRLTQKTYPNGMKQRYSFDDADRVLEVRIDRADGSVLETVGYSYDAAGRRTRREATVAGIPETPIEATYDQSNRLTSLTINGLSHTLAYDENGNLTAKTPAAGQATSYTWDAGNRLIGINGQMSDGTPLTASFRYDALGRRIEKTVNGETVQYLYDGHQAIAEIRGSAISATLLTGLAIDEAIARYTAEGERTLLTDALGSVILSAKEDGSVATAYGYSPYGETQTFGTEEGNATQYTGRENDGTGVFYYRARYYDPMLKQWLSEDPIGISGGTNVYTYVNGNPVSLSDPMGLASGAPWPRPLSGQGDGAQPNWGPPASPSMAPPMSCPRSAASMPYKSGDILIGGMAIGAGVGMAGGIAFGGLAGAAEAAHLGAIGGLAVADAVYGGALLGATVGGAIGAIGAGAVVGGLYLYYR